MSLLNNDFNKLKTLNEVLLYRAQHQSNKIVFRFIADNDDVTTLTYRQLHQSALRIASNLLTYANPGAHALLCYSDTLEFIKALFGCFYAGVIAVPGHPPSHINKVARMETLLNGSDLQLLLTSASTVTDIKTRVPDDKLNQLTLIATDSSSSPDNNAITKSVLNSDPALLQFTSGTVTVAKGVLITQKNLMANASYIKHAMGYSCDTHGVSWLPVYHDMGLIGSIIQPVYSGASVTLFSSMRFIRDPLFWLRTLSKEKATASGAPDFAYRLCTNRVKPDQLEKLDLSLWKTANIGAELVNPETLMLFAEKFRPCGFSVDAFYPSYGMAETTLFISGKKHNQPTTLLHINKIKLHHHKIVIVSESYPDKKTLVGSGHSWQDSIIKIVDPTSQKKLSDRTVGEIWVKANNVAKGYWNQPALTHHAFITNSDRTSFFRTGDLGFIHNNELFITGRISDLISYNNYHIYSNEIESVASSSHPDIHSLPSIVFSLTRKSQDSLVLVQEIHHQRLTNDVYTKITNAICQDVYQEYKIRLHKIILVKAYQLPKTTSGKLMRAQCKRNYINQCIEEIFNWECLQNQ